MDALLEVLAFVVGVRAAKAAAMSAEVCQVAVEIEEVVLNPELAEGTDVKEAEDVDGEGERMTVVGISTALDVNE
eukprot:10716856-Ditylum_brightwellii.AAC.1